jgi:hypothetical protein
MSRVTSRPSDNQKKKKEMIHFIVFGASVVDCCSKLLLLLLHHQLSLSLLGRKKENDAQKMCGTQMDVTLIGCNYPQVANQRTRLWREAI